jgi:hypothetical protein
MIDMALLVEGSNDERAPFTAEQKSQFTKDIAREKKKLLLRAGAADHNMQVPAEKQAVQKKMWAILKQQEYQGELKYAPLRIAVQDAMVWSAPNVSMEF